MKRILFILFVFSSYFVNCPIPFIFTASTAEHHLYRNYKDLVDRAARYLLDEEIDFRSAFDPMLEDMKTEARLCLDNQDRSLENLQRYATFFSANTVSGTESLSYMAAQILRILKAERCCQISYRMALGELEAISRGIGGTSILSNHS